MDERIRSFRMRGKFNKCTIILVHAPKEGQDKPGRESFYSKLNQLYQRIPTHDTKIIVGDCNAEIGRQEVFKLVIWNWSPPETTNKNGIRATDFATNTGLVLDRSGNSRYPCLSNTGAAILQKACERSSSTTENLL